MSRCALRLALSGLILSSSLACMAAARTPAPALPQNDLLHRKLQQLRAQSSGEQMGDCSPAIETNHRYGMAATTEQINTRMFEIMLKPAPGVINSVKLPNTEKLRLFAITLVPEGKGQPVTVDLKSLFDVDVISNPGEVNGGQLDTSGNSFPADALKTGPAEGAVSQVKAKSGTVFQLPPLQPNEKNAITGAGQRIPVPEGRYTSVHLLVTSCNGECSGTFNVTYTGDTKPKGKTGWFTIVPDWCGKGKTTAPKDDFELLAKLLNDMGQGKRLPLKDLAVEMSPGAETAETSVAQVGFTWKGEKTETTFTATADVAQMFPGRDLSKVQIVAYVGVDDKGRVRVNGGKWQEFYWDEGQVVLAENTTPTQPFKIEIHGRNETGTGKLMTAAVALEVPAIREYEKLIIEANAFANMAELLPDGKEHAKQAMDAIAQSLNVQALVKGDAKGLAAAVTDLKKRLAPLGSYAKARKIYLIGYSHIDLAWLWPLAETIDSVIPLTFKQALRFMDEFPDFHFSMTQAQQYAWVEKTDPEMFKEIEKRVKSGQWELLGGMWSEPDCNLPSGESFVRQVLYGKRYFLQKFGYDSRIAMNPDSFGYNWQLAQILKRGGFDAFVTQKISWNDTWKFPYKLFWWQAPDDTRLLAYFPVGSYGENVDINATAGQMAQFENMTTGIKDMMVIYGVGDHGGGPTRAMINRGHQIAASPILPATQMTTTQGYFDALQKKGIVPPHDTVVTAQHPAKTSGPELPVWRDELYLERHRGTYTTHEDAKDGNRRSERILYNGELAAALVWLGNGTTNAGTGNAAAQADAMAAAGGPPAMYPMPPSKELHAATAENVPQETTYPAALFTQAWQDVCLLHMHDILPGSGIHQNYEESQRLYKDLQTSVGRVIVNSLEKLSGGAAAQQSRAVYNLLPWERTAICVVDAPAGSPVATGANGEALLQQRLPEQENRLAVEVKVPAGGYTTIKFTTGEEAAVTSSTNDVLENAFISARVDRKTGNLCSLVEKSTGQEMIGEYTTSSRVIPMKTTNPESFEESLVYPASAGKQSNILQVHGDYPTEFDAWEIGLTGRVDEMTTSAVVSECTSGPLFQQITVKKSYGKSTFQQTYRLYANARYIDVLNDIDWHDRHRMVKVAFPLSFKNKVATYEVPFGAIERPAIRTTQEELGKYEHAGIQWGDYDDPSGKCGLALLTMNKYGFDAKDNVLRLSLLRAPKSPKENMDEGKPLTEEGRHQFSYAIYPHAGNWKQADVVRHGYEYNHSVIPVSAAPAEVSKSLVSLTPSNVILSSLKKSEDDDSIIVRLYEAEGADVEDAQLVLPWQIDSVENVDLIERNNTAIAKAQRPARAEGNTLDVNIHHYEVLTYKLKVK